MEGLIQYAPYWLWYFAFACTGLWCWQTMFSFFKLGRDGESFITALGIVLLFTPAPLDSTNFAPAIFILILEAISGNSLWGNAAILWMLAALCLAMLVVAARYAIIRLKNNQQQDEIPTP